MNIGPTSQLLSCGESVHEHIVKSEGLTRSDEGDVKLERVSQRSDNCVWSRIKEHATCCQERYKM